MPVGMGNRLSRATAADPLNQVISLAITREPKRFGGAMVISDRFTGRSSAAERVVATWTTNPGFGVKFRARSYNVEHTGLLLRLNF